MPWRGLKKEADGVKTKLFLYEDKLEYKFKIAKEVILFNENNPEDKITAVYFTDEEGVVDKDKITSLVKYIETDYDKNQEPFIIHNISIVFLGGSVDITFEEEKEKHKVYEELYNWKYNLKEYKNENISN